MPEIIYNQSYRGQCGYSGTYSVDTTYPEVHNKMSGYMGYSNPAGMMAKQESSFPSGSYHRFTIYRPFLYWNTSGIPDDAIITDAEIRIYVSHKYTYRTFNIVVQNGQPTFPYHPIQKSNYYHGYYSGNGGLIASNDIVAGAWNIIPLNVDGISWINCLGETKLALRVSRDIDSDSPGNSPEGASAREEGIRLYGDPVDGIYAKLVVTYQIPEVLNVKATNSSVFARTILYGEIAGLEESTIVERGFEYKIQEDEPAAEDTGVEVKETKETGFTVGEYSLKNKELYDQQYIADNIVWWFRAYCKLDSEEKFIADSWMKNLPTVETGWDITNVVISQGEYGEEGYVEGSVSVLGSYTSLFTIDSKIVIAGSTGNDGVYTVVSSSLVGDDTVIVLAEPIEDATVDGKVGVADIDFNKVDGLGNIVSEGASDLTLRGFEVTHEFSGRLPDSWRFEVGGFEGEPEQVVVHDDFGVTVIDIYWAGTLTKTVDQSYELEVGAFSMTIGQMLFGWPIMGDCLIEGKAYKCRAFADNEFGRVHGEEVDFSTLVRSYLGENPPTTGLTVVKNETIENLPAGVTASRRGFRYGTTEAADEFDVHENGSFTDGPYSMMLIDLLPDTTYYIIAYIVVDGATYEGELETITTDPEGEEDEDEYPTPHFSPHGQDYREVETKVFAEVLASQGVIDFSGGKKTLPITNHLIQTNPNAKTIADGYLSRFKLAKTRMTVTFPTPLPFEREDTVDFSYGALLFKEDDEGVVHFKEDGEGSAVLMDQISMIIKKINSVGLTKTLESIEYVAELDLEHE